MFLEKCLNSSQVNNRYTPPALFKSAAQCLKEKNYKDAVFLRTLAQAFGYFDMRRVADVSAHQVIAVRNIETFGEFDEKTSNAYEAELKQIVTNPSLFAEFRQAIEKTGMPAYYPRYMVAHGMGVSSEARTREGLFVNFDGKKAWKEVIDNMAAQLPAIDFGSPVNLEAKYKLGCLRADQISSRYTPVDLLYAHGQCLKENRIEDAHLLHRLIFSYLTFDAKRVKNKDAIYKVDGWIVQKIFTQIFPDVTEVSGISSWLVRDGIYPWSTPYTEFSFQVKMTYPKKYAKVCANINRIGMPTYSPRYADSSLKLKSGFNAPIVWKRIMYRFLDCPVPFTGNMAMTHKIGCLKPDQVKPDYTPVDLLQGYKQCLTENNLEGARFLHQLALTYLDFDEERIIDTVDGLLAGKAFVQLRKQFQEQENPERVEAAWQLRYNKSYVSNACQRIRKIGIPRYYPRYMTAENGLRTGVKTTTLWSEIQQPECQPYGERTRKTNEENML